jgi:hypothetical protein
MKRMLRDTDLEGSRMSDRRTSCPGLNAHLLEALTALKEVRLDTTPLEGGSREVPHPSRRVGAFRSRRSWLV